MALAFLAQSEGGKPFVRWGAKACQWEKSAEGGKESFQFTQAIFDMEKLKIGWASIQQGQAPQHIYADDINVPIARPDGVDAKGKPAFKQAFSVNVYSAQMFGDNPVREFATNQKGSLAAINELHTQYEAQKDANAGKVPVVEFSGHEATGGNYGTNVPKLNIVSWVDVPVGLREEDTVSAPVVAAPVAVAPVAAAGGSEF